MSFLTLGACKLRLGYIDLGGILGLEPSSFITTSAQNPHSGMGGKMATNHHPFYG